MIASDQPVCFPDSLMVAVSSRQDGTMLDRSIDNRHHETVVDNRRNFCAKAGIDYNGCVYQIISYEPNNSYDVLKQVVAPNGNGVHADILYTETLGVGLFLPIADCIGTVVYDPKRHAVALAHLGRHASLSAAIEKTVQCFIQKGSSPKDLIIWMAPSVAGESYRMEYFAAADSPEWRNFVSYREGGYYVDLVGHNRQQFINLGVKKANIYSPTVNTATDANYYSHSQGDTSGRFAVVLALK